jgi:hypothetical protein
MGTNDQVRAEAMPSLRVVLIAWPRLEISNYVERPSPSNDWC